MPDMLASVPTSFQSTRPLRGETSPTPPKCMILRVFQSTRPLRGETAHHSRPLFAISAFQSTRPLRGETELDQLDGLLLQLSIHSPLAGRDGRKVAVVGPVSVFQSTRPLRGETAADMMTVSAAVPFNPLAPCGARLFGDCVQINVTRLSIHSPLAGRDVETVSVFHGQTSFNPLAPCGARRGNNRPWSLRWYFQSTRPLRGETRATM